MERETNIDIAKGIGIIFVVYGHTFCPFKEYIFLFHMPLFFLLSGLLYNSNKSTKEYIITKYRSLIVPYGYFIVVLNLVFIIISLIQDKPFYIYPGMLIRPYGVTLTLWFFLALFNVCVLFRFTDSLNTNYTKLLLIAFLFCTGLIFSNYKIKLPFYIDSALTVLVFFAAGFYYKKIKSIKYFCYIISLIVGLYYMYKDRIPEVNLKENIYSDPSCIFISLCLSFLILDLSSKLYKYKLIQKILSYLGKKSLIIFTLHILILELIYLFLPKNNEVYAVLNTFLAIIITLFINKILKIEVQISYLQCKMDLIFNFIKKNGYRE